MIFNLKMVIIDSEYCDYLRKFDNKVMYNMSKKSNRPFIGILFNIGNIEYFAPLSSPKPKHLTMKNKVDFFKIKNGELGAVNFNNMIPVTKENYTIINLNENTDKIEKDKYLKLLHEQLKWLNENVYQINRNSYKLYNLYNDNKLPEVIRKRCCNFKMLESKCIEYNAKI